MRKRLTLLLILVFLTASGIVTSLPVKAEHKTIVVPDDYPTIQAAIDNANARDTVYVKKGTYYAPYYQIITIDKSLSLIGEDPRNTTIDGIDKGEYSMGHYVMTWNAITIYASNVTITGFTIKNCNTAILVDELSSATGIKIIGNNILNNHIPITIGSGSDFLISGNNIADNDAGVGNRASNGVISDNNITGLGVWGCQNVTIKENNITGKELYAGGLSLLNSNNIYIYENNITDNLEFGIRFERGCNSTEIYSNNIMRNEVGVFLDNFAFGSFNQVGSGNKVYGNNLIENAQNAFAKPTYPYNISMIDNAIGNGTDVVMWDNEKVGNYWSDYQSKHPNATEVDASGIGDTPYVIDADNIDRYPFLMPLIVARPKISVLSPVIQLYNGTSVPLVFALNKPVNWIGFSLDGKQNVTITGNATLTGLSNGSHNVTVYAKDVVDTETSETVWFNVEEPFPTMLVIAAVVTVAIVGVGLLVYFKKRKH
jgi:nitrous oxidase accessory protein NosD